MKKEDVFQIARGEIGYKGKSSMKHLYDKMADSNENRYTKYFYEIFPNESRPRPWCVAFIIWCFVRAYGTEQAKKMLCAEDGFSPLVTDLVQDFRAVGRFARDGPETGDLVFLRVDGRIAHVGLIVNVTGENLIVIDGNKVRSSGIGIVDQSTFSVHRPRIVGYGKINYEGGNDG